MCERKFTAAFKRDAVFRVDDRGYLLREVAKRSGVSTKSIYTRQKQLRGTRLCLGLFPIPNRAGRAADGHADRSWPSHPLPALHHLQTAGLVWNPSPVRSALVSGRRLWQFPDRQAFSDQTSRTGRGGANRRSFFTPPWLDQSPAVVETLHLRPLRSFPFCSDGRTGIPR